MSTGGLGDKSFNDAAYNGLKKAEKELGVTIKYVEPVNVSEFDPFLRQFAEANFDLIIGIGFQMKDSIAKAASEYPNQHFVMVDEPIDLPNVIAATFDEAQGSFLAGALAGMMSKTHRVGFVGGLDVPLIRKFGNGFVAGAKYIEPETKSFTAFIGGNSPFNDPAKGKEVALSMADSGADVIYHAAAGSGLGVFEAVKEKGIFGVGVDSDQDGVVPGSILTSMMKNVDTAVFNIIKDVQANGFKNGIYKLNVANNGVGITSLIHTKGIIGDKKIARLNQIKADIISGKINVSDEVKKLK